MDHRADEDKRDVSQCNVSSADIQQLN